MAFLLAFASSLAFSNRAFASAIIRATSFSSAANLSSIALILLFRVSSASLIRPGIASNCSILCCRAWRTVFAFSINRAFSFCSSINAVISFFSAYVLTSPGFNCFSALAQMVVYVLTSALASFRLSLTVVTSASISAIRVRTFSGNKAFTTSICLRRPSAVSLQRENSTASKSW